MAVDITVSNPWGDLNRTTVDSSWRVRASEPDHGVLTSDFAKLPQPWQEHYRTCMYSCACLSRAATSCRVCAWALRAPFLVRQNAGVDVANPPLGPVTL